jgi:hypothetical protein
MTLRRQDFAWQTAYLARFLAQEAEVQPDETWLLQAKINLATTSKNKLGYYKQK